MSRMKYKLKTSDFVLCKNLNKDSLALLYCGEPKYEKIAYLQIEKLIKLIDDLDFGHIANCITENYECGRKSTKEDKKALNQLAKIKLLVNN